MIRAVIAVSLSLAASTGVAGVNELTALGPEGGRILDVEFHRATPGLAYMIAPPGFFRSTDGGSSWQLTKRDPGNFGQSGEIALDPTDSQRVYVAAGEQIHVSNDGGLTFTASLLPNRQGRVIRIECGSDGVIYAPDGAKMYRSQDRGQTWQPLGAFPQAADFVHAIAVDPTDSRVVYVSLFGYGIVVSRDSGATWQLASTNTAIQQTMHIEVDRTNPLRLWAATFTGVYRSDNAGTDWTEVLDSFSSSRLEIDPVNPQAVYATLPGGTLMRTVNGGTNWVEVSQRFGNAALPGLAIHPTQPERMIVYSDGIWVSSDAGANWTRGNAGVIATGIRRIARVRGTSSTYLATMESGIYRLQSDHTVHAVDNARLAASSSIASLLIQDLAVTSSVTLDTLVAIVGGAELARSVDGGSNWTNVNLPDPGVQLTSLAFSAGSPATLYVGTTQGVLSSVDLGDNWTPRNAGLPVLSAAQRLASTSDPQVLYAIVGEFASGNARLFRTTNGGQSWAATALPTGIITGIGVHPLDPQTVYVGHDENLSRTTDGGATWTRVNADNDRDWYTDIAVGPNDLSVIYASARTRVMRSTDGGATWERLVVTQTFYDSPTAVAADPFQENAVIVGSEGLGLRHLTIRPDLQLTLTAPVSLPANTIGTFTLQLRNLGPYHARSVQVVAQFAGATNVSATMPAGSCAVGGPQVVCSIERFTAGSTAIVTLTASSNAQFSLQAAVHATEADLDISNDFVSAQVAVGVVASPPPSSGGGGGGGGGGAISLLMLIALAALGKTSSVQAHHVLTLCRRQL
jgi:photosystem II stability/assembly factor-like uncharacterized protein